MFPPADSKTHRPGQRGVALLIVVSLLTVIGIMGVAFAFSMFLETQATRQFVVATQARYLAEAGISHARALLDEDRLGSRGDDTTESWVQGLMGTEADVDGDGTPESRWWPVKNAAGETVGRYAIQVTDETGKANLHAAVADPSSMELPLINLTKLLEAARISDAADTAERIERYRYGEDGKPGIGGVDDDGDGAIDEVDEYQAVVLRGDDRRFESLEDLVAIAGLGSAEVQRLSALATVYSWDLNVSVAGTTRVNVNTATPEELLRVLLDAGVEDPWQAAVNIADYVDADFDVSRVTKYETSLWINNQGPLGGWVWHEEEGGGSYQAAEPGGQSLQWTVAVPTGAFRVRVRGVSGLSVGDVTVAGQLNASIEDGASVGVFQLKNQVPLVIEVANREAAGTVCAFRGIELIPDTPPEDSDQGVEIRGVEAVRFNEVMVEPTMEFPVTSATFDPQGSDWGCPVNAQSCSNSGVGQARWIWTNPLLRPGRYYVRVFTSALGTSGQTVGEVRIEGHSQHLVDGQYHPSTVMVGSDGKISLTIGKTTGDGTYYLRGIMLSLQPDAEYVELINLSDRDVDVGGWTIGGEATLGLVGTLPGGTVVKAHEYLVAVVDLDDTQEGMAGNGIGARSAWEIPDGVNVVQVQFPPDGGPSVSNDWLKITLPPGSPTRLVLRHGAVTVDEVTYPLPLPTTVAFQSLEKGDPSVAADTTDDGFADRWYPSLQLRTPGACNDNDGLKDVVGLETIVHDPAKEVMVLNRPLGGVGELAGLASGKAWKPFATLDLARIVDRFTVEGLRLEVEGHLVEGADGWTEKSPGYYEHSNQTTIEGVWQWIDVPDGRYRLSVYSCAGCSGEQMAVRWQLADGTMTEWSPALTSDVQGRILVGEAAIGMGGTASHTLRLSVSCASVSGICHVDAIRLDPQLIRIGPVNVNTAPLDVLLALPKMTDPLASRIITHRPYGDRDEQARGIGDLLLGDVLGTEEEDKLAVFRALAHLLTTRSDMFHLRSVGQVIDGEQVRATQRIQAVVQR